MLVCLFAFPLLGGDLSGIWSGTALDRNGDVIDFSFRFVQSGGTFTGKIYGDNKSSPISEGKVEGDQVTFTVITELNGQITKTVYTGTISGDEMKLIRERVGGNFNTKNKGQQRQPLTLKRVA